MSKGDINSQSSAIFARDPTASAVTGNILEAQVGLTGIPEKYREYLELSGLVLEVADDLWRDTGVDDPVWQSKYNDITYGR